MIIFSIMGVIFTSAAKVILPEVNIQELWHPAFLLSYITSENPPPGFTTPFLSSHVLRVIIAIFAILGVSLATI